MLRILLVAFAAMAFLVFPACETSELTFLELVKLKAYAARVLTRQTSAEASQHDDETHYDYNQTVTTVANAIYQNFFSTRPIAYRHSERNAERGDQDVDEDSPTQERTPVDFLIVIDSSAKIGSHNFNAAKQVAHDWVNILDDEEFENDITRVGLLTFSEPDQVKQELVFSANQNKTGILNKIIAADYHNGTVASTDLALWTAELVLDRYSREEESQVILLITDGWSHHTLPFGPLWPAARLKQRHSALIFVLGISDEVNHPELVAIASKPADRHLFEVRDYNTMDDVIKMIEVIKRLDVEK